MSIQALSKAIIADLRKLIGDGFNLEEAGCGFKDEANNQIVKVDKKCVYFLDYGGTICNYPLYELSIEEALYIMGEIGKINEKRFEVKDHTFSVTLKFADKISSDKKIQELAQNIANAITNQADGNGIAPEDSETHLESVEVIPQFLPDVKVKVEYDFNHGWTNK